MLFFLGGGGWSAMGKETHEPLASPPKLDFKKMGFTWMLVVALGLLSSLFYMLGSWQTTLPTHMQSTTTDCKFYGKSKDKLNSAALDFNDHYFSEDDIGVFQEPMIIFPACDMTYSEYTPCEDTQRSLRYERDRLIYKERHCPSKGEDLYCLIPAPPGYKNPLPWPKSRESAWYSNVPHKELTVEKAIQNWIQYEGNKFRFPGGGTMFPKGANSYIDDINQLISLSDGSIRTALDTGCGVHREKGEGRRLQHTQEETQPLPSFSLTREGMK